MACSACWLSTQLSAKATSCACSPDNLPAATLQCLGLLSRCRLKLLLIFPRHDVKVDKRVFEDFDHFGSDVNTGGTTRLGQEMEEDGCEGILDVQKQVLGPSMVMVGSLSSRDRVYPNFVYFGQYAL